MSNFSHPMVRRSERNPRAEAVGGNSPSSGRMAPPTDMESNTVSSDTITESPDTDSSDEVTELIAAASPPSVNGSPGVRMGESADAVPFPPPAASEVEPDDPEVNTYLPLLSVAQSSLLDETAKLSLFYEAQQPTKFWRPNNERQ